MNMFDLEKSVRDWRNEMAAGGIKRARTLDELESHLREEIESQRETGLTESEAFALAARRIGSVELLKSEFDKAPLPWLERARQFALTLAGMRQPEFAIVMNITYPNTHLEPRWATYSKGITFMLPALLLWMFSVIFLAPKYREICQVSGTSLRALGESVFFDAWAVLSEGMFFLTYHGVVVSAVIVLTLLALEWRSQSWPKYRRMTVGIGSFLLNLAVLLTITLMFLTALIAATNLQYSK